MHASRRAVLAAVYSSTLGVGLIFGFEPPLIGLVLSRAGSSGFAIGAVTAASLIAVIACGPFYPRVIARLGLKASIVAGVGCATAIMLLMPVWPTVGVWLVLRFSTGCALGLSWIASEVWLNNLGNAADRGAILGVYGTVFSAGVMAGPVLLEWTGTRGWQPFAIGAVCLALTLSPLLVLRGVEGLLQAFTPLRNVTQMLAAAPEVMVAALVAGLVESAELSLLPVLGMHEGLGDRAALLLVAVFMAGNAVWQMPIGVLADRVGRRRVMGVCALLSALGPLLLRPSLANPLMLWPLMFLWGGTLYAFYSQGIAILGDEFAAAQLPTANALFVVVYCLGGVLGPSVGGLCMDAWPAYGLQAVLGGAPCLLLAWLALAYNRQRGRSSTTTHQGEQ